MTPQPNGADDLMSEILTGLGANQRLGANPTKEEVREEVRALKAEGKDGMEIGRTLGPSFTVQGNTDALDTLEEVLTEEFDDYGDEGGR